MTSVALSQINQFFTFNKTNMKRTVYSPLLSLILMMMAVNLRAQDAPAAAPAPAEEPPVWTKGAGIGLDFAQLLQINPRQGAGQNRLGLGGSINIFGNYRKGRVAWDNLGSWQFGVQRLGSGVIAQGSDTKIPFQKAIDELRINSKIGYKVTENSKFFYAGDLSLLSQLTPTYIGTDDFPGNFLSDISGMNATPLSKLFSPATITISAGIDFKPTKNLSFYYSPIGGKFIIVTDDIIAARGIHGNPVTKDAGGNIVGFENTSSQLGSLLRMNYTGKYLEDRFAYTSALTLFSNYLLKPENVDLDWTNELAFSIFKGFQAALTVNVFYDDDVLVQITDNDAPNGVSGLGKRVGITQQLLLKYALVF